MSRVTTDTPRYTSTGICTHPEQQIHSCQNIGSQFLISNQKFNVTFKHSIQPIRKSYIDIWNSNRSIIYINKFIWKSYKTIRNSNIIYHTRIK